ncbi:MAG TPA: hypothetical protein VNS34_25310 [Rhizobiaceae bacterium]|nr:hypothetical protein [Rhizobiaceae bacterium]
MYLIQILLPCADNSGVPFPIEEFERLKQGLATEFDGVTAFLQAPAEGLWKRGSNNSHDDIVVFEVMTEKLDRALWADRRAELEERFRQERVIIRHMSIGLI